MTYVSTIKNATVLNYVQHVYPGVETPSLRPPSYGPA